MTDPGQKRDIAQDIRELVAEILETDPREIDPNAQFVKDLGMDSMMALEILAGIEKKYRVIIPEEMLPQFTDVKTTTKLIEGLLEKKNT